MKQKDFNEGLNHIDSDLVEEFIAKSEQIEKRNKSRGILIRAGALAACLCLIVGAVLIPLLNREGTVPQPDILDIDGIPITNLQVPSDVPKYCGSGDDFSNIDINADYLSCGVSVTARLMEVLPDTYTFYNDWNQTEFRLLKMETVETHYGENMTNEFLYIVPVDFMTDFTVYSKFVFSYMSQRTADYSVLYNTTRSEPEAFETVIFGRVYSSNYWDFDLSVGFMAFDENDLLDVNLWRSTETWRKATERNNLERYQGYTLSQAIAELRDLDTWVYLLNNFGEDSKNALEDIKSFENALYIPYTMRSFSAVRYINGFATNEKITINANHVYPTKAHFTEEDLSALPDLTSAHAAVIDAFEKGEITPPHIKNYSEISQTANGIFGWYAKTENGVIGVIRVNWKYTDGPSYYDDAYYIVEYGSNICTPIDRDALLERIGEYDETDFVYKGDYDEKGKKPKYVV